MPNREITVINRSESEPSSVADRIEQWSKIAATVGIPVLIFFFGSRLNARLQEQTVAQNYVEIAVGILQDDSQQEGLRKWAADLLENSSPIPLPEELKSDLTSGKATLPETISSVQPTLPPVYEPTDDPRHCEIHLKYGNPSNDSNTICRLGFALSYDSTLNVPRWVSYRLLANSLPRGSRIRRPPYRSDPNIPAGPYVLTAFRGSGFDRGHLVPYGDVIWNQSAAQEAQFHSNFTPQYPGFNRGIWLKLELAIRRWVKERGMLFVVAGPVFESPNAQRLESLVAIPDQFFKIVFDPATKTSLAFLIPHHRYSEKKFNWASRIPETELLQFLVSVDDIERRTGLDFFSNISDEEEVNLEREGAVRLWG